MSYTRLTEIESLPPVMTNCKFVSYWLDESLKIFMQIFFVVAFLSLFFFLYVVNIEKEIFDEQINIVVNSLYTDMIADIPAFVPSEGVHDIKDQMYKYIKGITFPPHNYSDIREQNAQVIDTTQSIVITLAVLVVAITVSLVMLKFCTAVFHQFVENMMVLVAIALTEFSFLNLVTRNYIAVNPNRVKLYILQQIQWFAAAKAS